MSVTHRMRQFEIIMKIEQIEAEVLALPKDIQAALLARLLEHLGQTSEIDQQVTNLWVEEAQLRDQTIENGQVTAIAAEEVFQKVRASLQ